MAIYLGPKQVSQIKVIDTEKEVATDAQLLLNDGTMYYYLTEYSIQQLMTGYYIIKE